MPYAREEVLRVYVLEIGPALLERAFDRLAASPQVASCAIEPVLGRVRFLAPIAVADELVRRIYLDGGLRWCSRHDLVPVAGSGRVVSIYGREPAA